MSDLSAGATNRPVGVLERLVSRFSRRTVRWMSPFASRTDGATAAATSTKNDVESSGVRSIDLNALTPADGRSLRPVVVAYDTAIPMPTDTLALRIGGGFLEVALEFMGYFQQLTPLSPGDRVLEIGCGLGRMAYPLACFLNENGSYNGFDVDAELIAWANDTIGAARRNFHFEHADVRNRHYNAAGKLTPESFRFPAASEAIDVTLAVSLFTHLPALVARHYVHETARVLRDGGTAFLTAFLVDDAACRSMAEGRAILHLGARAAGGWVADAANPEFAIGFPAADFLGWMAEAGLEVTAVYPGNWSGRTPFLSFQDIIIARRSSRHLPGHSSVIEGAATVTP